MMFSTAIPLTKDFHIRTQSFSQGKALFLNIVKGLSRICSTTFMNSNYFQLKITSNSRVIFKVGYFINGMLRKTNCARASLRRSPEEENRQSYGSSQVYSSDKNSNRKESSYNNNMYSAADTSGSKYNAPPPYSMISTTDNNVHRESPIGNDHWKSNESNYDRKIDQRSYMKSTENTSYDRGDDHILPLNSKGGFSNKQESYAKPNNKRGSIVNRSRRSNDVNRNDVGEVSGVTELVPGIRIEGQVAEL